MAGHRFVKGLAVAILLSVLAASARAMASPQEDADALATQGVELRRSGDDRGALPFFRKAHQIAPTPRSAVQLGLVEYALGQWADAEEHLAAGLKAARDPWIRKNRAVIEESLRTVKTHIGSLEVTGEPAGAEVLVNGRRAGQLPLPGPLRVSAGSVDVELNAPGYTRGFRSVTVNAGQYQTVVLRLASEPIRHPDLPPPPPPPPPPRVEHSSNWHPWAAVGAFASAALAAGTGIFGVLRYNDRVGTFNKNCDEGSAGALSKSTHLPDAGCANLQSQYQGARTLSIVGFSVAGALAATGVVFLVTTPDRSSGDRVSWTCAPDLARVGAVCGMRF
jgi:hypothetical protein